MPPSFRKQLPHLHAHDSFSLSQAFETCTITGAAYIREFANNALSSQISYNSRRRNLKTEQARATMANPSISSVVVPFKASSGSVSAPFGLSFVPSLYRCRSLIQPCRSSSGLYPPQYR
ncbi:hypothetical protein GPALN_013258 [Globodera pallida]|nr:hypothetical protein GPALN_013258 [Globodera pallida]